MRKLETHPFVSLGDDLYVFNCIIKLLSFLYEEGFTESIDSMNFRGSRYQYESILFVGFCNTIGLLLFYNGSCKVYTQNNAGICRNLQDVKAFLLAFGVSVSN